MDKLRPCPFCGLEMPTYRIHHYNGDVKREESGILTIGSHWKDYQVVCPRCGAQTQRCDTEQEAVDRWNGRA